MTIKELKKGEYFTLKAIDNPTEKQVYVKGDYDRSEKRYEAVNFADISKAKYLKPNTVVYVDFIF